MPFLPPCPEFDMSVFGSSLPIDLVIFAAAESGLHSIHQHSAQVVGFGIYGTVICGALFDGEVPVAVKVHASQWLRSSYIDHDVELLVAAAGLQEFSQHPV